MSQLGMLTWSLQLDRELFFRVQHLPLPEKMALVLRKYASYAKRKSAVTDQTEAVQVFGGGFHYNDPLGLASLQRVYCSSHHLKALLPEAPVVVDVGANIGQFNHFSRYYLNASRVVSIEPEKETYRLLQLNSTVPDDCVCSAVGDREGEVLFHVATESTQLSSYVPDDGQSYRDTYAVPCRRLDEVADELKIGAVDLLKVDTEGSEWDVLTSAGSLLSRTRFVLVEMSIFRKSSGNLFQVGEYLRQQGFELVDFSCGRGSRPRDADGLFRRL